MEITTKEGPKRLRRTRRELPEGGFSQWPEGWESKPTVTPLEDEGEEATDSVWLELRAQDQREACDWTRWRIDVYLSVGDPWGCEMD